MKFVCTYVSPAIQNIRTRAYTKKKRERACVRMRVCQSVSKGVLIVSLLII